jgi:hypothetical protein
LLSQYVITTEKVNFWKLDSLVKELPGCFVVNLADDTSDRMGSEVRVAPTTYLKGQD